MTLSFAQIPDPIYHDLITCLECIEEQREQVQPSVHFSEAEHVMNEKDTILEKLEQVGTILRQIVGQESMHRHHIDKPAKSKGRRPRDSNDE
jgi:hypothetical protein